MPRNSNPQDSNQDDHENTNILFPKAIFSHLQNRIGSQNNIAILIGESMSKSVWKVKDISLWSPGSRRPQLQGEERYVGFVTSDNLTNLESSLVEVDWTPKRYVLLQFEDGEIKGEIQQREDDEKHSVTVWTPSTVSIDRMQTPQEEPGERRPHPQESDPEDSTGETTPDVDYLNLEDEVRELQKVFADITAEDFTKLNNGSIGVEVTYVPTECGIEEFEVFIEFIPQYPELPPRMWVMSPDIEAESNMIHRFDEYGHAQAAYTDPYSWNEELTGGDAAQIMKQWIANYCDYIEDEDRNQISEYSERLRNEVERLTGN